MEQSIKPKRIKRGRKNYGNDRYLKEDIKGAGITIKLQMHRIQAVKKKI